MANPEPTRAWLLIAAGDDRGHGGNDGYDDQVDAYYSWDSEVINAARLQEGDPIAIWDKDRLLGVSVIEAIDEWDGIKEQRRCVECGSTKLYQRKRVTPKWRCQVCREAFDEPALTAKEVRKYRARHDAAWTPLEDVMSGAELRALQTNRGEPNAMRPMDWLAFQDALAEKNAVRALERMAMRVPTLAIDVVLHVVFPQGFTRETVRVRRGQGAFRAHLLAAQGSTCAFTGGAHERALEAAHLYSYGELGTHYEHGGLMLRRDVHRLFDDGWLAVDPATLRLDVVADLEPYEQYARLHGERIKVDVVDEQVSWIEKHWIEHRSHASV